jgi:ATP-binding cassette subfamily E protein 1
VKAGNFTDSEIIVLLGQNGTGKTTFIRMLAGIVPPDDQEHSIPELHVSYKPQKISPKFNVFIPLQKFHLLIGHLF